MFDVGQLVRYPLDDQKWVEKTLIGGALNLIPIINFFSTGYALESLRLGTRGEMTLPEWEDWGDKFVAGIMVFVIGFIYTLIPILLMFLGVGLGRLLYNGDMGWGVAGGVMVLLTFVVGLFLIFILPMALAHFAAEDRIQAAFEIGEICNRIRAVFGDYLVAGVLFFVFSMILVMICIIPVLGWIVFIFGIFYLSVIFSNLVGRLYRQASAQYHIHD